MTDRDAFLAVKTRLNRDVGGLIELIDKEPTFVPFWALIRALFPIAESISDLLYFRESDDVRKSQEFLIKLLRERFGKINPGYTQYAGVLVVMYRHSLTHQDVLRAILYQDAHIAVAWAVSFHAHGKKHVEMEMVGGKYEDLTTGNQGQTAHLFFDLRQFYLDLDSVLDVLLKEDFGGKVGKRYQEWLTYRLGNSKSDQEARKDIDAMPKVTQLLPLS